MGRKRWRPELRLRIRVLRGREILLGPGKADLLEAIRRLESLRAAAAELGMSYMRAWTLVRTMNRGFRQRLVETKRGGPRGGRASLTASGEAVLADYREMDRAGRAAAGPAFRRLVRRTKP